MYLEVLVLYACCYLAGSVPTAYLIARLAKGIDLRQYGSGNVGGSNVARQLGKKWMAPLAAIEVAFKGVAPFLLALLAFGTPAELPVLSQCLFLGAPLLALVGNNWSVFLRFQGGRGLTVVSAMVTAVVPLLFLVVIAVYLVGWRITHNSAVWALIAVLLLPVLALLPGGVLLTGWGGLPELLTGGTYQQPPAGYAAVVSAYCGCILALVLLKRVLSNSLAFPENMSRKRVIFNRLLRDRDVDDRTEWVSRIPQ